MTNPPRAKPGAERRLPLPAEEKAGSFGWVRKALAGHLALERRGRRVHVVLQERRKPPPPEPGALRAGALQELRDDLRVRLFDLPGELQAAEAMRHLMLVHDELGRHGWHGVEALPARVLGKALVQAEMLASREPSPPLALVIERLALLKVGAEVREGASPVPTGPAPEPAVAPEPVLEPEASPHGEAAEVSETNYDEYELMERSWAGTVPAGLPRPDRGR